jgi:ankyrin repeat protein
MRTTVRRLIGWCIGPLLSIAAGYAASSTDSPLVQAVKQGNTAVVRSLLNQHIDVNQTQPDGTTTLAWAAQRDDPEMADVLIRAGAKVNAANDYGATPLWIACSNGNTAMVEKLLKAGADATVQLISGETALMTAAESGSTEIVKLLVAHGAHVNAKENQAGQTALMWAAAEKQPEAVRVMVEHGAEVNARSKSGFTALLFAAQQDDAESAEILLAAGANVNQASDDGTTPLLKAAANGQEAVLLPLLNNGADPNASDVDGYTALHHAAARRNRVESVRALLAYGAKPNARLVKDPAKGDSNRTTIGATPFFLAAEARSVEIMRLLASKGADPLLATTETMFSNEDNGYRLQVVANTTPLMAAAGSRRFIANYPEFTEAEERTAIEAVKLTLELGADINEANEYGQTALHTAAYLKADKLVQFLVDNGAKIDLIDKFGQTPLSIAARVITEGVKDSYDLSPRRNNVSTYNLLLKLGATPLAASGIKIFQETPVKD